MTRRARPRRLSFSARLALLLCALGVLVAAAVVAIPLARTVAQTRQVALNRVADQSSLLLGLVSAEQASLTSLADACGRQAAAEPDLAAVVSELSSVAPDRDVVGVTAPGGGTAAAQGVLDSSYSWLLAAAPARPAVVTGPGGAPWLLGIAGVPGRPGSTVAFVARSMSSSALAQLSSTAGGNHAAIAVVRDGRYVLDARVDGVLIPAGAPLDPALAGAAGADAPSQLVRIGDADVAAVSTPIGDGYRLLVTAPVPPMQWLPDAVPVAIVTAALVVTGLVLVFLLVQRDLRNPLRRLDRAVEALAREDFDVPVATGGDESMVRLGDHFIAVRGELQSLLRLADARAAIATELGAPASVDAALRMVCDRLRTCCGADLAVVVTAGQGGRPASVHAAGAPLPPDADALLVGEGIIALASERAAGGAVLACPLPGTVEAALGLREVCAAPLRMGGATLGVVAVSGPDLSFLRHVRELVEATADQVALALERERVLVMARLQASTDSLTGLSNRRFLTDFLEQQVAIADRTGTEFSVVMLDLDNFKAINDTHGHEVGDEALRQVARTLGSTLRKSDLAARLGGDEFLVVMSDTVLEDAARVAEKLRRAVAQMRMPTTAQHVRARVTVSVGVASRAPGGPGVDRLLTVVDDALYEAKRAGRDRVAVSYGGGTAPSPPGPPSRRTRRPSTGGSA